MSDDDPAVVAISERTGREIVLHSAAVMSAFDEFEDYEVEVRGDPDANIPVGGEGP